MLTSLLAALMESSTSSRSHFLPTPTPSLSTGLRMGPHKLSGSVPVLVLWPRIISASMSTRTPILPVTLSWVLYSILEMGKVICFYAPEAVSNIPYSYTEAILENGAFVVENMRVLRPFVLNGHGATLGLSSTVTAGSSAVPPTATARAARRSSRLSTPAVTSNARTSISTRRTSLLSMSNLLWLLHLSA